MGPVQYLESGLFLGYYRVVKKCILFDIGVFSVFVILSCELPQVPNAIRVQGDPVIYLPLGNPFAGDTVPKIADYLSIESIRQMVAGSDNAIGIYEYDIAIYADVQTYVVRYPMVNMPLDLTEYMKRTFKEVVTEIDVPSVPLFGEPDFMIPIPIETMTKLVKVVWGQEFGIRMPVEEVLKDNLEIMIPEFGFSDYKTGVLREDGYLYFLGDENNTAEYEATFDVTLGDETRFKFDPQQSGKISLYLRVRESIKGISMITPEIVFDWDKVTIDTTVEGETENNRLEGSYPLDMGDLMSFLGMGVMFKNVHGYVYVHGLPADNTQSSLRLDVEGENLLGNTPSRSIIMREPPDFSDDPQVPFTGSLFPDSIAAADDDPLDLLLAFNAKKLSQLHYSIVIYEVTLDNSEDIREDVITADLVIELPLDFEVKDDPDKPRGNYVKLDLGDVLPDGGGDGDLFGRTGEDETSDVFNSLNEVTIYLKNYNNTVFNTELVMLVGDIEVALPSGKKAEIPIPISKDKIAYPFNPRYEILLPKDEGKNTGTFSISRSADPTFEFSLEVKVAANIDQTIDF
ncbi:MAG: hypothetical protein LBT14_11680 [Treponema sp.]|nr:hypothetical protein [Treponema sp.]